MDELTREVLKLKLLKEYPGLTAVAYQDYRGELTTAAKNIRAELKAAFPGIKFAVRTERYTGGTSLNVTWTDGPTTEMVDAIAGKYQEGSFNGMEDIYEYGNRVFTDIFGGAKYVFAQRARSDALVIEAIAAVAAKFGAEPLSIEDYRQGGAWRWVTADGYSLDRELNIYMSGLNKFVDKGK